MINAIVDTLDLAWKADTLHKREFGQRLRWLREAVMGLSRANLAQRSGVPARTIIDIENGHKAVLDRRTVCLLAQALELTGLAQRDFVTLAGLKPSLEQNLVAMDHIARRFYEQARMPAFIIDPLFDFHSCNSFLLALFDISRDLLDRAAYTGAGPNLLRFLFDPIYSTAALLGHSWHQAALTQTYLFRTTSYGHEHEARYQNLIRAMHEFPDFRTIWQEAERACPPPQPPYVTEIQADHGRAQLLSAEAALPAHLQGTWRAMVFVPLNDTGEQTLAAMRASVRYGAYQFGSREVGRFTALF